MTPEEELYLTERILRARRGEKQSYTWEGEKNILGVPKRRKEDPFMRGLERGALQLIGLPVDAWAGIQRSMASSGGGLRPVGKNPIMGSDWLIKNFGPAEEYSDAGLGTKVLSRAGEFTGNMLAGAGAAELPALRSLPLVQKLFGGMSLGTATRIGITSGIGSAVGEEYGGPLGSLVGMFAAPMVTPKKVPAALKDMITSGPLASETGSVSMGLKDLSQGWQNTVGSKLQSLVSKVGDIPLAPSKSRPAKWMGGNTLNEWALAPQERMNQNAAQIFRDTRSEAERTADALRTSAMQMKGLNLAEREDLRSVLRSNFKLDKADPANRAKIQEILEPIEEAKTITGQKLLDTKQRENLLNDNLNTRLLKLFAEDPQDPMWQLRKSIPTQHDLSTPKGTLKFLDSILSDPLTPPNVREHARDLYDLPAKTALEVADAHRKSYEKLLFSSLKNNPDWVTPQTSFMQQLVDAHAGGTPNKATLKQIEQQIAQYTELPNHPDFEGLLVKKDIAEGIRDLDTHISAFRTGWNKYFLNPWKFMKVGLNVPARARDLFSNIMFNDIYGPNPLSPYRLDVYGSAMKELRAAAKTGKLSPELETYFYHTGGKIDALNSVATDPIFNAMRHDANPLDNVLGWMYGNKVGQFTSNLMRNVDVWTKYAKFKHNIANGMEEAPAIVDALRSTGNMLEQSRAVRNIRDTAMPFFGWSAHALKTVASGMMNHPVRTAKWYLGPYLAGQYAIDNLGMDEQSYADYKNTLPEYMKDEVFGMPKFIPLPYRDEKNKIQMMDIGWWIPGLQDLSELDQNASNPIRFVQNPAFTIGASLLNNKKFSGAPIYHEWEEPGTKVAKSFGYIMGQLMPPLTPGVGNQANKIWEAFKQEDPNALSLPQALGSQVGARITPIDEGQQWKKFNARINAFQNEAKHQMKDELSKTTDPENQNQIYERYQNIFLDLMKQRQGQGESTE